MRNILEKIAIGSRIWPIGIEQCSISGYSRQTLFPFAVGVYSGGLAVFAAGEGR
ncbi:hypothetical protein X777_03153 [Ooceraea biroi]|uniref:Uncharacterized protein n=1 Tax=Ooceraea biroi TaxID=2015173 RepID=A0A026WPE7_OOCBI|nr:hypothetical protein X777_03153 [Ooceraea biroi]